MIRISLNTSILMLICLGCQENDTGASSTPPLEQFEMADVIPRLDVPPPTACISVVCPDSEVCSDGRCIPAETPLDMQTGSTGGRPDVDLTAPAGQPVGDESSHASGGEPTGSSNALPLGETTNPMNDMETQGDDSQHSDGMQDAHDDIPAGGANPPEGENHLPEWTPGEGGETTEDPVHGHGGMENANDLVMASLNGGTERLTLCSDTCPLNNDGRCQDGGPQSLSSFCSYGTDCADCGDREPGNYCPGHERNCICEDGRETFDAEPRPGQLCLPYTDDSDCARPQIENPACTPCTHADQCRAWGVAYICHQGACSPPRCTDDSLCDRGRCSHDGFCDDTAPSNESTTDGQPVDAGLGGIVSTPDEESNTESEVSEDLPTGGRDDHDETHGEFPEGHITEVSLCANDCSDSNNGYCDDNGPRSASGWCVYGSDCDDCGIRSAPSPRWMCENSCPFRANGRCEDGGIGSAASDCPFGTDCVDCGARAQPETASICSDTCYEEQLLLGFYFVIDHTSDGICDDGGPNAFYTLCPFGSDCTDCGAR